MEVNHCGYIDGWWARDGDTMDAIDVHIYAGAPSGQGGQIVGFAKADREWSSLPKFGGQVFILDNCPLCLPEITLLRNCLHPPGP